MTKYNTGNPVGSSDPRDLSDNAQNADNLENGTAAEYPDRLGVSRKSRAGMEADFNADQADRQSRFNQFLAASGYEEIGDYAAGIEVTEYNQIIRDGGEGWRPALSTTLPYTTTGAGMPEGGAFVSVGDANLRQELQAGSADIGGLKNLAFPEPALSSYTAMRNKTGDATRLYIEPNAPISAGVGGVLKIFADPYTDDQVNYRDIGIFFSADQASDTGYSGDGVFYLNSKANGTYENPDIAVTFQDGALQAMKWSKVGGDHAVTVIGKTNSTTASARSTIGLEMGADVGLDNERKLWWWGTGNFSNYISFTSGNSFEFVSKGAPFLTLGHKDDSNTTKGMIWDGRFAGSTTIANTNGALDVSKTNTVRFVGTTSQAITDFTNGVDDQRLVLIGDGFTRIDHGASVKLRSGANYVIPADTAIQLVHHSGVWYEIGASS